MKNNASAKQLTAGIASGLQKLQKYSLVGFMVVLAAVYGFVFFRITTLANEQPSTTVIDKQVKSANVPKIDTAIVEKLETLQDNSVSVSALFNEARSNPFE